MSAAQGTIAALLKDGLAAQGAGNLDAAEALYRKVLLLSPEQPDALQLLGTLARRGGAPREAEALFRRSLQSRPEQPHVWNNLGNLLHAAGRSEEALQCLERAVGLKPDFADGLYNLARVRHAMGQADAAREALARALRAAPGPTAGMLQLQAQIESDQGDLDAALGTLDRALALAPDRPALLHNRATLLHRRHRYRDALTLHERARALGLDEADAHYNRGNTLQGLGRNIDALAAYRDALRRNPRHRLALYDACRLRWRMGHDDFDADLIAVSNLDPQSALGPDLRGQLLYRAERYADAADAYAEAVRRQPDVASFHDGRARSLVRAGDVAAGLAAHERACALAPEVAAFHAHHAASLLVARRPEAAERHAWQACRQAPDDQYGLAILGLAWRVLGDPRESWLNDYQAMVSIVDLPPPRGWPDMATFAADLAAELDALHVDAQAPLDQTLRSGTQTFGDIFEQGHPHVDALKQPIAEAIDSYLRSWPDDPTHPLWRRRRTGWRFTDSWSSRLRTGGYHTHHVHPHGWISSAFYVRVPEPRHGGAAGEGWLCFGIPDFDIGLAAPERMRVEPRAGRLVLFPSMFWHGTLPFDSQVQRTTIAFDVMPV